MLIKNKDKRWGKIMKKENNNLCDKMEVVGIIVLFMGYLAGASVVTLFKKTKNAINKKIRLGQTRAR